MPTPTTQNFFDASNWMYGYPDSDALPPVPSGLAPFYYEPAHFDSGLLASGFHGAAFSVPGPDPEIIIAFEGTDVAGLETRPDFLLAQIEADLALYTGQVPQALRDAAAFARQVLDAAPPGITADQVHLTGHSLGAAEAAYASTQTGLDGTTFAAPGLSSTSVPFRGAGSLTNFVDYGDPIGNYSSTPFNIEGAFLYSSAIQRVGSPTYIGDGFGAVALGLAAAAFSPDNSDAVRAAGLAGFAALADDKHPLTNYGTDLGLSSTNSPVSVDDTRIVSGDDYRLFFGDFFDNTPLVADAFYEIRNPDVRRAGLDAEQHYEQYGWREGRDPNAFFSTTGYLAANGNGSRENPLQHYAEAGWRQGRDPSAGFDTELYLKNNPDVAAAGINPLAHFLEYGRNEGRQIYEAIGTSASFTRGSFDAEFYFLANADVAAEALTHAGSANDFAYQHYEQYGWKEGRDPNAFFDTRGYLDAYADVRAAGIDPLQHYDRYGWLEGRDPSTDFDSSKYLAIYTDVAAAGLDPLTHYLQYGALEGRSTFADGTFGAGTLG